MSEQRDFILTNAKIVLADRVIERGWLAVVGGMIGEIGEGGAPERGNDLGGDLLLPGLVELHTDHLEAHYSPRPKVYWNPVAAVVSFDGQLATCGITTVLDSLRVWREEGAEDEDEEVESIAEEPKRTFEATGKIKFTSQDHRFLRALKIAVDDESR